MERKYRNIVGASAENKRLYGIRLKMIERCTDASFERYKDYGGRGIRVCQEWLDDYDAFADWAKENGYQLGLTIDRIDNDGDYEPSNCRWITRREQNRNKRTNKLIEYRGEVKPLVVWCEELGLRYDPIHNRIEKGWDVERAFNVPLASEHESFSSICRRHGVNPCTAHDRIKKFGWSFEDAVSTPSQGMGGHRKANFGECTCGICGATFIKTNSKKKYCSQECVKEARRRRERKVS